MSSLNTLEIISIMVAAFLAAIIILEVYLMFMKKKSATAEYQVKQINKLFGGKDNVTKVSASSDKKLKIEFKDGEIVDMKKVENGKGVKSLIKTSKSATLSMESGAKEIAEQYNK